MLEAVLKSRGQGIAAACYFHVAETESDRFDPFIVKMVETDEHEQYLKKFGCFYAQGYHYYKPMDVSSLEKIIKVRENVDYSGIKGWLEEANEEPEEPETSVIENSKGKNFFREIVDIRGQVRRKVGAE